MTQALRYPPAKYLGNGHAYGDYIPPWNQEGFLPRLVWHTTETPGLPGYNNGDISPHLTYDPKERKWYQHVELNKSVGALKDGKDPIRTNRDGAIQVEIICYSAKNIADQSPSRLWVGDLTDEQLGDLAAFGWWLFEEWGVPLSLHPKTMLATDSSAYGANSITRMSTSDWDFRTSVAGNWGWTAHRSVPDENTHWDTGALDIPRILELAKGNKAVASPYTDVPDDHPFYADIMYLWETEISKGYSGPKAGTFGPDDPVTRAQMAAFLRRALAGGIAYLGLERGLPKE